MLLRLRSKPVIFDLTENFASFEAGAGGDLASYSIDDFTGRGLSRMQGLPELTMVLKCPVWKPLLDYFWLPTRPTLRLLVAA